MFVSSSFGCLGAGGGLIVSAVDELQQVLHPPVVLHAAVPLQYRLVFLPFRLLLLALCQTQTKFFPHLCIVSTGRSSWGLEINQNNIVNGEYAILNSEMLNLELF